MDSTPIVSKAKKKTLMKIAVVTSVENLFFLSRESNDFTDYNYISTVSFVNTNSI